MAKKNRYTSLGNQLQRASIEGDLITMRKLINEGADVNFVPYADICIHQTIIGENTSPVVHYAALNHQFEAVELLVENKANINIEAQHKLITFPFDSLQVSYITVYSTPLKQAIAARNSKIVEFLLKSKALPDFAGEHCSSPLHEAVSNLEVKSVQLLLEYNANPSFAGTALKSPLKLCQSIRSSKQLDKKFLKVEKCVLIEHLIQNALENFSPAQVSNDDDFSVSLSEVKELFTNDPI